MKYFIRFAITVISLLLLVSMIIDLGFEINYLFLDTFDDYSKFKPATAAIVPGAAVYGKKPSTVLKDRLKAALLLYQNNKVKKILLSGDNSAPDYNEIRPMLNFMLNNKVKKDDIFVDYAGFRTLDTMTRAKVIFKINDAIIVTQKFHQPRAAYIAQKVGIRVACYESDFHIYKAHNKNRLREYFARNLAWVDMNILNTHPKFLGDTIPITGSGNQTWDYK